MIYRKFGDKDISLLGFDNLRLASLPQVDLTTVEQPKEEMAVSAVTMLQNVFSFVPIAASRRFALSGVYSSARRRNAGRNTAQAVPCAVP